MFLALAASLAVSSAAASDTLELGGPARLFALPSINEEVSKELLGRSRVSLADFVGVAPQVPSRAVVVYFFDRSHGGDGLSELQRLHRQQSGKGLQVLAVATDAGDLGQLSTWVQGQKLDFPVLRDNHHIVVERYGFPSSQLPAVLIIEEDGDLVSVGRPSASELVSSVDAQLRPLLNPS
jgi:peroxiredoxin